LQTFLSAFANDDHLNFDRVFN